MAPPFPRFPTPFFTPLFTSLFTPFFTPLRPCSRRSPPRRVREHVLYRHGVQHITRLEPPLPRNADADVHVVEAVGRMRIRADLDLRAASLRGRAVAPIEIEPVRI